MTFDTWMHARNPKYHPTDDTVALRELRDCWRAAEYYSARAQDRELMIELMRDKCRKVGVVVKADAFVEKYASGGDMCLDCRFSDQSGPGSGHICRVAAGEMHCGRPLEATDCPALPDWLYPEATPNV